MKIFIFCLLLIPSLLFGQEFSGSAANSKVSGADFVRYKNTDGIPNYVSFSRGSEIQAPVFEQWLIKQFALKEGFGLQWISSLSDLNGMVHNRYSQQYYGIPVENASLITHGPDNIIKSWNGNLAQIPENLMIYPIIDGQEALLAATNYVGAVEYRWQNPFWEQQIKQINGDSAATWFPIPQLIITSIDGQWELAYMMDIYASQPFSRQYVFVSAADGRILKTEDRLRNTDVTGTAYTVYSGVQTITTDSYSGQFRLRETGRGLGIETYNLNAGTSTASAVDFMDADNSWNNINAQKDQYATDAHWGAEKTYDYFFVKFGRNSINNAGQKLISYVHFDVNWVNAMWDGTAMYYGDGDASQGITPLTTIDICGHEITHGLTENTANLEYALEPGALNEGFSDIFGIAIRYYAKPSDFSWLIGDEMGWTIRNMSNPNQFDQPDTYHGNYWDPYEEVHTNSGVMNFWFYLLSTGGSGTNDNGDAYSVSPITIDSAAAIAYRMLTVYLSEYSDYSDARFYSILAAADLFGECSPEMISTTNAWYAVGVGNPYNSVVTASFISDDTLGCMAPHVVSFENLSETSFSFFWDFGDGTTSTAVSPTHTYNSQGSFDVSLIADGGLCGKDTIEKVQYIIIDETNPCVVVMPASGTGITQTACYGILMDSGGEDNYPDESNSRITISPTGAQQVTIIFTEFALEDDWDYLYIYDGDNTSDPQIGVYTGYSLPNGGTISSSGPSITLRLESDVYINESGFKLSWHCITSAPDDKIQLKPLIFPDPVGSELLVGLNGMESEDITFRVVDISGKVILSGTQASNNQTMNLNVAFMVPGYYYLMLVSESASYCLPFVKE